MKKVLFDLFPILCFFLVFRYAENNPTASLELAQNWLGGWVNGGTIEAKNAPILLATITTIVATFIQLIWLKLRRQKIDPMLWITLGIVVVFGGLTIRFNDDHFIKWKPTILYLCFGFSLLIGQIFWHKNGIQSLMGKQLSLPAAIWKKLLFAWIAFFIGMAGVNLWVAYQFDTSTWVNFKLFGTTGLMLLFVICQGFYVSKYLNKA